MRPGNRGSHKRSAPVALLQAVDNLLNMSHLDPMSKDNRICYPGREQGVITITLEAVIAGIVIFVWICERKI